MQVPSTNNELLRYWLLLNYKRKFDDTGTYVYVGTAPCGTATSSSVWQIKRIDSSTGDILWAKASGDSVGNSNFDKCWDDRASYTYE